MSTIGLFGKVAALTGGAIAFAFMALYVLSWAEKVLNRDEQPTATPKKVKEELWPAVPTDPSSSSASSWPDSSSPDCSSVAPSQVSLFAPGDSDALRLRRRSHTRALRSLRRWLRIQGYRPPVQRKRPMIMVSCRRSRPFPGRVLGFVREPLALPGQAEESVDGPPSEPAPDAPS